jgi:ribonuclease Y
MERRLVQKEENLERKFKNLERKERNVSTKEQRLYSKEQELGNKERENQKLRNKAIAELERVGHLTREEAKRELIKQIEDEAKLDSVQVVKK